MSFRPLGVSSRRLLQRCTASHKPSRIALAEHGPCDATGSSRPRVRESPRAWAIDVVEPGGAELGDNLCHGVGIGASGRSRFARVVRQPDATPVRNGRRPPPWSERPVRLSLLRELSRIERAEPSLTTAGFADADAPFRTTDNERHRSILNSSTTRANNATSTSSAATRSAVDARFTPPS